MQIHLEAPGKAITEEKPGSLIVVGMARGISCFTKNDEEFHQILQSKAETFEDNGNRQRVLRHTCIVINHCHYGAC